MQILRPLLVAVLISGCGADGRPDDLGPAPGVSADATEQQGAPGEDVANQSVVRVADWSSSLIERTRCGAASDVCVTDLWLQEGNGEARPIARGLEGPFIVFAKARKVLSCESNSIVTTEAPILIELDGTADELPVHPGYLRECRAIGGGEEALLVYDVIQGTDSPYRQVRVVASSGAILLERRTDAPTRIEVQGAEGPYTVEIGAPELPG